MSEERPDPQAFGDAVRLLRAHRKLTQETLAGRAGLSHPHLCRVERGQINPTLRTITAVSGALEVQSSALIALAERVYNRRRSPGSMEGEHACGAPWTSSPD